MAAGDMLRGDATGDCCDSCDQPRSHDTSRIAWAKLMAREGRSFHSSALGCGGGRFVAYGHAVGGLPKLPAGSLTVAVIGPDASNTSLCVTVGDAAFAVKLMRRCRPGIQPEVEVGTFVAERTSWRGTPRLCGWLDYELAARPGSGRRQRQPPVADARRCPRISHGGDARGAHVAVRHSGIRARPADRGRPPRAGPWPARPTGTVGTSQPAARARTRLIEWKTVAEV